MMSAKSERSRSMNRNCLNWAADDTDVGKVPNNKIK